MTTFISFAPPLSLCEFLRVCESSNETTLETSLLPRIEPTVLSGFASHRLQGNLQRNLNSGLGHTALAIALYSLWPAAVLAQTIPNAGSLLRDQAPLSQPALPMPALPGLTAPPTSGKALTPASAETQVRVTITRLNFTGDIQLAQTYALADLAKDLINRPVTQGELFDLADSMTATLRNAGLLIARATLPPQDLSDGMLQITLSGGRLGDAGQQDGWKLNMPPALVAQAARLQRLAEASVNSGSIVQQTGLERGILLLGEQPGASAQARLQPGPTPGSTQAVVDITAQPVAIARVSLDNSGTPATGVVKVNAIVQVANLLNMGDQLGLLAQASSGTQVVLAQASAPLLGALGSNGARAQFIFTGLDYTIKSGTGAAAGLSGTARQFDLGITYPALRSVGRSADLSVQLQHKNLSDNATAGALRSRRINALQTVLDARWQGTAWGVAESVPSPAYNTLSIGLRTGQLDLSRIAADNAADAAGLRSAGRFTSLQYAGSREQLLPVVGSRQWSGYARLRGQASNKNLDPAEQLSLGGPSGVRGYPAGEATGDSGFLATLEVRYSLQGTPGLQAFSFFDTGRIRVQNNPGAVPIASMTGSNSYGIGSTGLGMRYGTDKLNMQLTLARALGKNDGRTAAGNNADGQSNRTRAWLALSYSL